MNWRKPFLVPVDATLTLLRNLEAGGRDVRARLAGKIELREDDVFIATFPKSGTTVMQMMLYQMLTNGDMDLPHINVVSPWYEIECGLGNERFFESLPSPRIFKTHRRFEQLPRGARYIYVLRDIRGAAVSAFHHYCLITGTDQDLARFLDRFLEGRAFCGCWFRHVQSWWPHRNDPDVLFLTYESLVGDLAGTVRQVAAFLNIHVDEARLPIILERCSIGFMKKHGEKFDPRMHQSTWSKSSFIRTGKADGWRNELSSRHQTQIQELLEKLAEKLGSASGEPFPELLNSSGEAK